MLGAVGAILAHRLSQFVHCKSIDDRVSVRNDKDPRRVQGQCKPSPVFCTKSRHYARDAFKNAVRCDWRPLKPGLARAGKGPGARDEP